MYIVKCAHGYFYWCFVVLYFVCESMLNIVHILDWTCQLQTQEYLICTQYWHRTLYAQYINYVDNIMWLYAHTCSSVLPDNLQHNTCYVSRMNCQVYNVKFHFNINSETSEQLIVVNCHLKLVASHRSV